jgi:predicted HD phosphohydrolase
MKSGTSPEAIAVFAAAHADVGDILIFDDGCEITLVAGKFTHGHFSDFDSQSLDEAEEHIVEAVIEFLERLFADQVVLWGTHHGGGGWYLRKLGDSAHAKGPRFVWSGPLIDE